MQCSSAGIHCRKTQLHFYLVMELEHGVRSQALGTAGVALTTGELGLSVGTSLLVMMQEMGLIGLVVLGGFIIWIILYLVLDIRKNQCSPAIELRYALLLFSLLWPVWLWYAVTWTMRVPMLLYWILLGYVLAESRTTLIGITDSEFGRIEE